MLCCARAFPPHQVREQICFLHGRGRPPDALLGLATQLVEIGYACAWRRAMRELAMVKINFDCGRSVESTDNPDRDNVCDFTGAVVIEDDLGISLRENLNHARLNRILLALISLRFLRDVD